MYTNNNQSSINPSEKNHEEVLTDIISKLVKFLDKADSHYNSSK